MKMYKIVVSGIENGNFNEAGIANMFMQYFPEMESIVISDEVFNAKKMLAFYAALGFAVGVVGTALYLYKKEAKRKKVN